MGLKEKLKALFGKKKKVPAAEEKPTEEATETEEKAEEKGE